MKFNAYSSHVQSLSVYLEYKYEIDGSISVSDEKASFIIKSIMAGVAPRIYVYNGKIVKGKEILVAMKRCFDGELVFTGELYTEINGKNYNQLLNFYHSFLEEKNLNVVRIGYDVEKSDLDYFLATINQD